MIYKSKSAHNRLLKQALFIRNFEEKLLAIFNSGKLHGTTHTCIGQEIIPVCISQFIKKNDIVISNHRNHGHFLSLYANKAGALLNELLGSDEGLNSGLSGSQHIHYDRFFASGIQGGLLPYSLGLAWVKKQSNKKEIIVCYLGDGTMGEGVVYECWNIASKLELPIIYVIEDNQYSQSTHHTENMSGSILNRAKAFGIEYYKTNSFDLESLLLKIKKAFYYSRSKSKPVILHIDTYRLSPHSKGDDFRSLKELDHIKSKDLISRYLKAPTNKKTANLINKKVQTLFNKIMIKSPKKNAIIKDKKLYRVQTKKNPIILEPSSREFIAKTINVELHKFFKRHKTALFLGEDIRDPYGGAFKVSKGLSQNFNKRIMNMPISEAAIVGMGFGIASTGRPTIVEIMFGDFISLAFDQILNQISKYEHLLGKKVIPLIIRTPMGARRGYGLTHSQSLEKFLYAIPNIDIYIFNCWMSIPLFYANIAKNIMRPSIFIEYKNLYSIQTQGAPVEYQLKSTGYGQDMMLLCPSKMADLTVVVFGGISFEVHKIIPKLTAEEVYLDIFSPINLKTSDVDLIIKSVNRTNKIIFIEEGTGILSISTEFFKKIVLDSALLEKPKCVFIHATDNDIPSAPHLEQQVVPSSEYIFNKCLELFND